MFHRIRLAFLAICLVPLTACSLLTDFSNDGENNSNTNVHPNCDNGEVDDAEQCDDGYWVVWTSIDQDGDQGGIYFRQIDENGLFTGEEIQVNTTPPVISTNPLFVDSGSSGPAQNRTAMVALASIAATTICPTQVVRRSASTPPRKATSSPRLAQRAATSISSWPGRVRGPLIPKSEPSSLTPAEATTPIPSARSLQ